MLLIDQKIESVGHEPCRLKLQASAGLGHIADDTVH